MSKSLLGRLRAGLIASTLIVSQVFVPVQSVFAAEGNNGTLKIHEAGTPPKTESNSPKVCSFNIESFGLDDGQTGSINFEVQGGDGPTGTAAGPFAFGPADAEGYYATQYFNLSDGHYKATLLGAKKNGNGVEEKAKSKVFKVKCTGTTVQLPAEQKSVDPCNPEGVTNNVAWKDALPADTEEIDWTQSMDGTTRTATLFESLDSWSDGTKTPKVFTLPADSGEMCKVVLPAVAVPTQSTIDLCNLRGVTNNVAWAATLPGDSEEIDWSQSMDGTTRTATLKGDREWSDGSTEPKVFTLPDDKGEQCERESAPCTVTDQTYDHVWNYDGDSYPAAGPMVSGQSGSFSFENSGLYLNTPVTESYVYGFIDAGDTNLLDVDAMSYKVLRLGKSAGFEATLPAYILLVDTDGPAVAGGLKYFFYEPYYNDQARASVEDVWQTWDAYDNGNAKWWMSGTGQAVKKWSDFVAQYPDGIVIAYGFNQGTYNADTYTAVQDLEFDCATTRFDYSQGMGSVDETPVTPPVTTTQVGGGAGGAATLPAELPMTGNGGILTTWFALLAAIVTYGAVFFLQPKKQGSE